MENASSCADGRESGENDLFVREIKTRKIETEQIRLYILDVGLLFRSERRISFLALNSAPLGPSLFLFTHRSQSQSCTPSPVFYRCDDATVRSQLDTESRIRSSTFSYVVREKYHRERVSIFSGGFCVHRGGDVERRRLAATQPGIGRRSQNVNWRTSCSGFVRPL